MGLKEKVKKIIERILERFKSKEFESITLRFNSEFDPYDALTFLPKEALVFDFDKTFLIRIDEKENLRKLQEETEKILQNFAIAIIEGRELILKGNEEQMNKILDFIGKRAKTVEKKYLYKFKL
jgi:hypothetical protein